ncbi:MAG: hypothetical protein QG588_325 [Candidatus Poribacteria bacterium]|nr:hypothetical protein [Candidatus Poribacteria bacterium]
MKKWGVVTFIFLLAFIILPVNSFGSPTLYWNEGNVDGLEFAFDSPLPVNIGGFEFNAAYVKIETTGREVVLISQSLMYNYAGEYNSGYVYIWGVMPEFDSYGNPTPSDSYDIILPMNSASLVERFQLDALPTDPFHFKSPDDTSLIFKAKLNLGELGIVNFKLVIQKGIVTFAGTI